MLTISTTQRQEYSIILHSGSGDEFKQLNFLSSSQYWIGNSQQGKSGVVVWQGKCKSHNIWGVARREGFTLKYSSPEILETSIPVRDSLSTSNR